MPELTARDAKLVQYLNEAYGKEKQLETALEAHIAMTTRDSYRKRLQAHLRETKQHARTVERRIKQLGGVAETVPLPVPEPVGKAAQRVQAAGQKAAALARGPLHVLRGTGEQEKLLKNAKAEYSEEAQEIATYRAIETLAEAVGDRETATLARAIRREEERMAGFLERLIPTLAKAVAQEEIPAAERNGGRRRSGRRSTKRRSSASAAKRATRGRTKAAATSRGRATKSTASSRGRTKSATKSRGRTKATAGSRQRTAASGSRRARRS
jgi:ferritin-like metal-binding protein YciE